MTPRTIGGRRAAAVTMLVVVVMLLGATASFSLAGCTSNSQGSTGVLHVVAVQVVGDGEGRTSDETLLEAWLDDANRRYRVTQKYADGTVFNDLLVDGGLLVSYTPEGNYGTRQTYDDPDAYELGGARRMIFRYQELLDLRVAKQTGAGQQGGISTITVLVPPMLGDNQDVEAVLDAVTFALLTETVYLTSEADRIISHTIKTTYTTWETVPDEELPAGVFQMETPDTARFTYYTYLTEASAAAITDRPIYYLGSEFNGIPVYSITIYQKNMNQYGVPDIDRVRVSYGQRRNFWQRPPVSERPYVTSELYSGKALGLSEGGTKINLIKGDTMVTIGGQNEAEVADMMYMLKQINAQ